MHPSRSALKVLIYSSCQQTHKSGVSCEDEVWGVSSIKMLK